jgi:glycosyltransferase involved in cell wall biosynthesis
MRILQVIPTYLPALRYGGPIIAVHSLCRALVARGNAVDVFTTNVNGAGSSAVSVAAPVKLDGVRIRYFASNFLRRLSWAPSLKDALAKAVHEYDVIHLHSVFLWPTWAAAQLARRAQVPYVVSPRGMLIKDLIAQRNSVIKSMWINLIEKTNIERASAVHLTSNLELQELHQFRWRLPRTVVIPNGVDEPVAATGLALPADIADIVAHQPLVLFLGRLSWKKGLDRLLKAFARTPVGTLAIVGTDDEDMVPQLSQLAETLQISDRVRFLPRTVTGSDRECLYAAARVFVLSSYSENFGNTVLEAMRRGIPVVVTPEVGAAEIVANAEGGLVVSGDPEPLGHAIGPKIRSLPVTWDRPAGVMSLSASPGLG